MATSFDTGAMGASGSLLPRFRRLFSFGDVLDESVRLFRAHWVEYAQISAVALLPPGLIVIGGSIAGLVGGARVLSELGTASIDPTAISGLFAAAIGAIALIGVVAGLFSLLWTAAVVVTADAHMRGGRTGLAPVYRRALSRYLAVLVASVLFGLVIVGLTLVASVLFVLTVFGVLGSLVALVGAIVWWLKPSARKPWLKWLIILTAPFGLPTYFGVRWAMYIAAIVLEGSGPVASLRRSGQLTDGHWFRVGAILAVASLVVGVLQSLPTYLVQIPLSISALARGQPGLSPTEEAISYAVSIAAQIVFASIGLVVYALLFVDLRNRREGTDIVERLSQLEASPVSTNG